MQDFILNIYILNFYTYGLQFIYLYPEVQFVPTYFYVFLKPIFCTDFHILQGGPSSENITYLS